MPLQGVDDPRWGLITAVPWTIGSPGSSEGSVIQTIQLDDRKWGSVATSQQTIILPGSDAASIVAGISVDDPFTAIRRSPVAYKRNEVMPPYSDTPPFFVMAEDSLYWAPQAVFVWVPAPADFDAVQGGLFLLIAFTGEVIAQAVMTSEQLLE